MKIRNISEKFIAKKASRKFPVRYFKNGFLIWY